MKLTVLEELFRFICPLLLGTFISLSRFHFVDSMIFEVCSVQVCVLCVKFFCHSRSSFISTPPSQASAAVYSRITLVDKSVVISDLVYSFQHRTEVKKKKTIDHV